MDKKKPEDFINDFIESQTNHGYRMVACPLPDEKGTRLNRYTFEGEEGGGLFSFIVYDDRTATLAYTRKGEEPNIPKDIVMNVKINTDGNGNSTRSFKLFLDESHFTVSYTVRKLMDQIEELWVFGDYDI